MVVPLQSLHVCVEQSLKCFHIRCMVAGGSNYHAHVVHPLALLAAMM